MKKHLRLQAITFFVGIVSLSFYFQNCSSGTTAAWNNTSEVQTSTATPVTTCQLDGITINGTPGTATPNFITAYPSRTSPAGTPCIVTAQIRYCTNGVLSGSYPYSSCVDAGALSCTFNGQTVASGSSIDTWNTSVVPYGVSCGSAVSASPYYLKRTCTNGVLSGDSSFSFSNCAPSSAQNCAFNGQTIASGSSVDAWNASTVPYGTACGSSTVPSPYYEKRTCTNGTLSGDPSFSFGTCTPGSAVSCNLAGQTVASGASITAYRPPAAATLYNGTCQSLVRNCTNGALDGDATYSLTSCPTPQGCSVTITTSNGPQTIGGSYDASLAKCVFPVCNDSTSTDCANKTGTGRQIDGRLPQMTGDVENLCKKYGADYDFYYVQRMTVIPSCGYYYGLAYASDTVGDFGWNQQPLCWVTGTGFPVPSAVYCLENVPANSYLPEPGSLPSLNKGSYNSVPFDANPTDNNSLQYCPFGSAQGVCCSNGVDTTTGMCIPEDNSH